MRYGPETALDTLSDGCSGGRPAEASREVVPRLPAPQAAGASLRRAGECGADTRVTVDLVSSGPVT